ncbi:MAG: hypothetical protein V3V99_15115 [candidate division Zixibacteria bacterium]
MTVEDSIKSRIKDLIEKGQSLKIGNENGQVRSDDHEAQCMGWITTALHIIQVVIIKPDSAYRTQASKIAPNGGSLVANNAVGAITALLENLLKDIELGMLTSIDNRIHAGIYDDFLDHAEDYLKKNMKNESGVIAGVVFEDSIRKLCRSNAIVEKDEKVDALISELQKMDIFSPVKAKRARVAGHVRTKATHAQWDEFDIDDVKATIDFTKNMLSEHLDN